MVLEDSGVVTGILLLIAGGLGLQALSSFMDDKLFNAPITAAAAASEPGKTSHVSQRSFFGAQRILKAGKRHPGPLSPSCA